MRASQPIFIIGSYRSATSALTWAIGQHPNIFPLEETNFLGRLSADLGIQYKLGSERGARTFLSSAGISRSEYYGSFGRCVDEMVVSARSRVLARVRESSAGQEVSQNVQLHMRQDEPKLRWIDGTPENSFFVLPLRLMFPGAKFIFILRHPAEVARSLAHFDSIGGKKYSEAEACQVWTGLVRSSALAERAFGEGVVLRVSYEEIKNNPEETVRRCLAFVGEEAADACKLPLRERINSSVIPHEALRADRGDKSREASQALALYESIVSGEFAQKLSPFGAFRRLVESAAQYQHTFDPATIGEMQRRKRAAESENRRLKIELRDARRGLLVSPVTLARRLKSQFGRVFSGKRGEFSGT